MQLIIDSLELSVYCNELWFILYILTVVSTRCCEHVGELSENLFWSRVLRQHVFSQRKDKFAI